MTSGKIVGCFRCLGRNFFALFTQQFLVRSRIDGHGSRSTAHNPLRYCILAYHRIESAGESQFGNSDDAGWGCGSPAPRRSVLNGVAISAVFSLLFVSSAGFAEPREVWVRYQISKVMNCYSPHALCARYDGIYSPTGYFGDPGCIVPMWNDPSKSGVFPVGKETLDCPEGHYVPTDPDGCTPVSFKPSQCVPIDPSCPNGEFFDGDTWQCREPDPIDPNGGRPNCPSSLTGTPSPLVGNPINAATGNNFESALDIAVGGASPLRFMRYYNSAQGVVPSNAMGRKWGHTYSSRLNEIGGDAQANGVNVYRSDGEGIFFASTPEGFASTARREASLQRSGTDWLFNPGSGDVETYDAAGRLRSIRYSNSQQVMLGYDPNGTLTTATDQFGKQLTFEHDSHYRVTGVSDPDGARWQYHYDSAGNLATVVYPDRTADETDNPVKQYRYAVDISRFNATKSNHLLTILDERGDEVANWTYDNLGRATSSAHAEGSEHYSVVYNADGTTTVTDPNETTRVYTFDDSSGVARITDIIGGDCSRCGQDAASYTYDANGFLETKTDFNGNVTRYVRDAFGRELSRTEAEGSPQARTVTTVWDTTINKPLEITEPGRIITFTYGTQGRLESRVVESQQ